MCEYSDGKEYTIGDFGDDTVEVIQWKGDQQVWVERVKWSTSDTVGDAIKRAKDKREEA